MEPNFRAGKSKVPIHCFDRIKGAIFFPRSMVATSHKQLFGVNEKLIEYLYKQLKEFGPSEKPMAEQFKKLRESYRRMLTKWHNHDAEVLLYSRNRDLITHKRYVTSAGIPVGDQISNRTKDRWGILLRSYQFQRARV